MIVKPKLHDGNGCTVRNSDTASEEIAILPRLREFNPGKKPSGRRFDDLLSQILHRARFLIRQFPLERCVTSTCQSKFPQTSSGMACCRLRRRLFHFVIVLHASPSFFFS
jgi:hypothetical protein